MLYFGSHLSTPRLAPKLVEQIELPANKTPEKRLLRLRSEEHTSELQSLRHLVCRLLLEKKNPRGGQVTGCHGSYAEARALAERAAGSRRGGRVLRAARGKWQGARAVCMSFFF